MSEPVLFVRRGHFFTIITWGERPKVIFRKKGIGYDAQSFFEALFGLEFVPKKLWIGPEEGEVAWARFSEEQLSLLKKICAALEKSWTGEAIEVMKVLLEAHEEGRLNEVLDALMVFDELTK